MLKLYFRIFIIASISFLTVIYTSKLANTKHYNHPIIWAVPGLERITPQDSAGNKTRIQLRAARGEYEPFQIGIKAPPRGLNNVNVFISDLTNDNGEIISQKNITLYREHYIFSPAASPEESRDNFSSGVGWYADGLIPFINPQTSKILRGAELDAVPFDLKARKNQPIWVDIFVPRDTPPGQYRGTYTVTSDHGYRRGKISLKVWDFELPQKSSLNSALLLWEQKKNKAAIEELLKHKVIPGVNIDPSYERELIDTWGLNVIRLPFWDTCKTKLAPSLEEIRKAIQVQQEDLLFYAYSADEVQQCENPDKSLREWERNLHQAGAKQLIVTIPKPELHDDGNDNKQATVHIWVITAPWYNKVPNKITEVLAKGDEVWFYPGLQGINNPKWLIDYPPINFRIPQGFISQSLGIKGFLYWRADLWTDDPWNQLTVYVQDRQTFPGEGMLIYPGDKVGIEGVVPSMRLKWIREGIEDYEYIEILKQLGDEEWAMEIVRSVGADWQNWTKDPAKLELARRQLGDRIESLQKS
ncbi:MAG: glycoside hydrolase domain-containing protein [Xenococcaceae cyanobacterium]